MMLNTTRSGAQPADNPSLPFARDAAGTLYVNATRLCQIIGIDPKGMEMRLFAWRTLAEFLEQGFGDDSRGYYLPMSMMPDFLEALRADSIRLGVLNEVTFYQHLFGYINDFSGKSEEAAIPDRSAERMNRVHSYLLRHFASDRETAIPET